MKARFICILTTVIIISTLLFASGFEDFEKDVVKFKLENGATLLLLKRDDVPIIHCVTIADVGAVKEKEGKTGIAHFLEHLAFKGTETIGTTSYEKEKVALQKCDEIFSKILDERKKGENADSTKIDELNEELDAAVEKSNEFVIDNEFSKKVKKNGGKNLNAGTGQDMTMYYMSFPSNKLELWMALESDRFTNPIFRQFYQERKVILEEKRLHENSPTGKLVQEFVGTAYKVHPYKDPIIGYQEDIENITRQDIREFFEKHYGAQNLTFAIIGDIDIKNTKKLAQKYLEKIPKREESEDVAIVESSQKKPRTITLKRVSQPFLLVGYHIPNEVHPDAPAYNALADILGQGRSSRLHRKLVEDKKIAIRVFSFKGFPGSKYPGLFAAGAMPAQGHNIEECLQKLRMKSKLSKMNWLRKKN